jgi:hypothetical protein
MTPTDHAMSNTMTIILLASLASVAIWAQWCAIRRAENLACKLAAMRDEAGKLYAENMRLRDELEARR